MFEKPHEAQLMRIKIEAVWLEVQPSYADGRDAHD
jgi:hypothetical protein